MKDRHFKKTILILEPDKRVSEMLLQAITEGTPYRVVMAESNLQALQLAAEAQPDLLILAYQLDEITGIDIYDLIHKQPELAHIPALILSGDLATHQPELSKRNLIGIQKPFYRNGLIESIQQLLD